MIFVLLAFATITIIGSVAVLINDAITGEPWTDKRCGN